ncbi:hypothetical protein FRC11_012520 [Ceratobasidium sp. 423]|nr:hypothetical protein FRC11_012520 [Ceratobasidium sp. 423]
MVWAGAGEHQQAFETYGRARQGIVTKATCGALAPCVNQAVTCQDLWSYLVQEIDGENKKRMERDASKSINERQLPHLRVQHAELWVSQCDPLEPLRSAGPVLDRPML